MTAANPQITAPLQPLNPQPIFKKTNKLTNKLNLSDSCTSYIMVLKIINTLWRLFSAEKISFQHFKLDFFINSTRKLSFVACTEESFSHWFSLQTLVLTLANEKHKKQTLTVTDPSFPLRKVYCIKNIGTHKYLQKILFQLEKYC